MKLCVSWKDDACSLLIGLFVKLMFLKTLLAIAFKFGMVESELPTADSFLRLVEVSSSLVESAVMLLSPM